MRRQRHEHQRQGDRHVGRGPMIRIGSVEAEHDVNAEVRPSVPWPRAAVDVGSTVRQPVA